MTVFQRVEQVQDLRDHYSLIEQACERLNARAQRAFFAPDVYADLLEGRARAVLAFQGQRAVGFFATRPGTDSEGRPTLLVWLAYVVPGTPGDVLLAGMHLVEHIAKEDCLGSVVFATQRKGWLRAAAKLGYRLTEYRFEKVIA